MLSLFLLTGFNYKLCSERIGEYILVSAVGLWDFQPVHKFRWTDMDMSISKTIFVQTNMDDIHICPKGVFFWNKITSKILRTVRNIACFRVCKPNLGMQIWRLVI